MVKSIDCLAAELLQLESSQWHVFLLTINFCFASSAMTVSIRFFSTFETSDFIMCLYIALMFDLKYEKIVIGGFTIISTVRRDC